MDQTRQNGIAQATGKALNFWNDGAAMFETKPFFFERKEPLVSAEDVPNLLITPAPHIRAADDVASIMRTVALALAPAVVFALYRFGYWAWVITALAVLSCIATEAAIQSFRNQRVTVNDWSAIVTGLLLAAVLPPNVGWYIPVIGGVVSIGVAKHCFGGLGCNIWNPALIGRAFLQIAFPSQINMSAWPWVESPMTNIMTGSGTADVITSATPLQRLAAAPLTDATDTITTATTRYTAGADASAIVKGITVQVDHLVVGWNEIINAFLGNVNGSIGEVSALALLIGGVYLLYKKIISWHIPAGYLLTVALLGWMLPTPVHGPGGVITGYTAWFTGPMLFHIFAGGVMIGALFMATDMVTSPMSRKGKLIFGVGCGFITIMIRLYSSAYPEGVCYSILLMNTLVPLIDSFTSPRVFGTHKKAAVPAPKASA